MTGFKTPEAVEILNAVLAKDPAYPLANLKLTEIYSSQVFQDNPKFRTHIEAYCKACPGSLAGYSTLGGIDDAAFFAQTALALRKLIETHTDAPYLLAYRTLWNAEFKATPLSEHARVRERVRTDAARLRAMDLSKNEALLAVLGRAYTILDDKDGSKWVEEHLAKWSTWSTAASL